MAADKPIPLTKSIANTLLVGLKMYEASVKRMQNSKPQYADIYSRELVDIAEARKAVTL